MQIMITNATKRSSRDPLLVQKNPLSPKYTAIPIEFEQSISFPRVVNLSVFYTFL